jgi:cytochrome b/b6/petD-like protein
MARDLGELNREDYARYKDDVKKEGKPFFPFAMWHDTVMGTVVVLVIIALAAIWYWDADGVEPGVLGPLYTEPADPGTTNFIPRPDWYFYFLFYLLRIFEWPETVFIATVGIPTICLILLLALPFYDRSRERRPSRRPVAMIAAVLTVISMGVLTWKGATATEALGSELMGGGARVRGRPGGRPGRRALRRVRLPELPHVHGPGLGQPRRSGPDGGRQPLRRGAARRVPDEPGAVREHGHGLVRVSRAGEPREARDLPQRLDRR